ncbi:hypothetical protein ACWGCC_41175 [Streptomyces nigrescens]
MSDQEQGGTPPEVLEALRRRAEATREAQIAAADALYAAALRDGGVQ